MVTASDFCSFIVEQNEIVKRNRIDSKVFISFNCYEKKNFVIKKSNKYLSYVWSILIKKASKLKTKKYWPHHQLSNERNVLMMRFVEKLFIY